MSVTTRPPGRTRSRSSAPARHPSPPAPGRAVRTPDSRGPANRGIRGALDQNSAPPALESPPGVGTGRFIAIVITMLAAGLILLLAINNSLAAGAFDVTRLESQLVRLSEQREAAQAEVNAAASSGQLQRRARDIGMVPAVTPAFLNLSEGAIDGVLTPAPKRGRGPARQVAEEPEPSGTGASQSAASNPSSAVAPPPPPTAAVAEPTEPAPGAAGTGPQASGAATDGGSPAPDQGIDGATLEGPQPPSNAGASGAAAPGSPEQQTESGATIVGGAP